LSVCDDQVVCRCEEILWKEIRACLEAGVTNLDHLKRLTRAGMGLCQGRSCTPLLTRLIAGELGTGVESLGLPSARPPVKPLPVRQLAAAAERGNIQPHKEAGLERLVTGQAPGHGGGSS
jgi:bacterioferritin-associated ferredoxin